MNEEKTSKISDQSITVQLRPGSLVSIYENVDIDAQGGLMADVVFEDTVERYNPRGNLLEFEESDIGYAEFRDLLSEYDSIRIARE